MAIRSFATEPELETFIDQLSPYFDVVRVVDPILTEIKDCSVPLEGDCFSVWNKNERCQNCLSARVLNTGDTLHKFERIGSDIFFVTSERIHAPYGLAVLELVSKMEPLYHQEFSKNQEEQSKREELIVAAMQDPLTGTFNRRYASEQINMVCENAKEAGEDVLVVIVDLDNLKFANDEFGHLAGDCFLKEVTSRVLRFADFEGTEGGFFARIGGDEFVVVKRVRNELAAEAFMELLCERIKCRGIDAFPALSVSASLGGALLSEVSEPYTLETFLAIADKRLYIVKQNGKGSYLLSEGEYDCELPPKKEGEERSYRRSR